MLGRYMLLWKEGGGAPYEGGGGGVSWLSPVHLVFISGRRGGRGCPYTHQVASVTVWLLNSEDIMPVSYRYIATLMSYVATLMSYVATLMSYVATLVSYVAVCQRRSAAAPPPFPGSQKPQVRMAVPQYQCPL